MLTVGSLVMPLPKITVWKEAPELALRNMPAILCDSESLWLAYESTSSLPTPYAIVRFLFVIDHRLSSINDEGLGEHPYFKAGLEFYSFNEITDSAETIRWAGLKARHWVVTFKDNTLDVIAQNARVFSSGSKATSPLSALLELMRDDATNKSPKPADMA